MATRKQVSYGSKGSDVSELQTLLNNNGYSLDVDGIYGSKTQAAVKDYQSKNGLAVDGIVGNNTWSALTSASTAQTTTPIPSNTTTQAETTTPKAPTPTKVPAFEYGGYVESDAVAQAKAALEAQLAQRPGAYQSSWQASLDEALNKILNKEKFSYDLNGDALYQQYKDRYIQQGQQAMMDTMGQASAMTGGYSNSYAQTAGQQTYQGYLQGLNDKVPELYQLARDSYNQDTQDLYNQYAMYSDREALDYNRYRDEVSDYNAALDRLQNRYDTEREYDYNKYSNDRDFAYGAYADDRNYQYQLDRDAMSDYQWQQSYDYQANRDKIADEQWQKEFDEAIRQYNQQYSASQGSSSSGSSSRSSSSSSSKSTGSSGYNNGSVATGNIKTMQQALGVTADGKWGSASSAAAGGLSADEAWKAYNSGTLGVSKGKQYSNGMYASKIEDMAYAYYKAHPNVPLDSRTIDVYCTQNGIDGDARTAFRAYLQAAGATTSGRR